MWGLFEVDWSFVLVIVSVTVLMVGLGIWSRVLKRRRKREEKQRASRVYKEWLASSNMHPLDLEPATEKRAKPRR